MLNKIIYPLSLLLVLFVSCENKKKSSEPAEAKNIGQKDTTVSVTNAEQNQPAALKDTGQQYFTVTVLKEGKPLASYEGDWPIASFSGNLFTLQLPASRHLLKTDHLLVLYFNGISTGTFPVAPSGSEKGKPTLIFTPVKDGSYQIGISAKEGSVVITKYSEKSFSGKLSAKGVDENGLPVTIQAEFINVKNNNLGD